jgi:two-component system cell cycle sensor histidine kinase/response regulator CckA
METRRHSDPAEDDFSALSIAGHTILLVEDDPQMRSLIRRMLEGTGYALLAVKDGDSAFRFLLQGTVPIDLFMVDVMIPGINGIDLMQMVQKQSPGTKIIVYSGQLHAGDSNFTGMANGTLFLQKPFTREALMAALHKALPQSP